MAECRYQVKVFGRVQGVGYRYFCRASAESLNIKGWARNAGDATVELEIQGLENDINSYLSKLEEGPPFSRVDYIEKHPIPIQPSSPTFEIRY